MISRKKLRARLNLPTRRVAKGELEVFESHNFKGGFGNWGDHISGEIISHFFNVSPKICTDPTVAGKTLVVGSVMDHAYPGDAAWGAGCIAPGRIGHSRGKLEVHAVRGPLTLRELRRGFDVPNVPFGDPALLMAQMHEMPKENVTFEYAVIPHWVDFDLSVIQRLRQLGVKVIDIRQSTQQLLRLVRGWQSAFQAAWLDLERNRIPNCRSNSARCHRWRLQVSRLMHVVGRNHSNHPISNEVQLGWTASIHDRIKWDADSILNSAPGMRNKMIFIGGMGGAEPITLVEHWENTPISPCVLNRNSPSGPSPTT